MSLQDLIYHYLGQGLGYQNPLSDFKKVDIKNFYVGLVKSDQTPENSHKNTSFCRNNDANRQRRLENISTIFFRIQISLLVVILWTSEVPNQPKSTDFGLVTMYDGNSALIQYKQLSDIILQVQYYLQAFLISTESLALITVIWNFNWGPRSSYKNNNKPQFMLAAFNDHS